MPFTDTGDLDAARRNAEKNVADLLPYVESGATVIAPGPSCSLMLKTEYPKLLANKDAERVARRTQDLMEFIYNLARARKLNRDFKSSLGKVAYHAPCHLRAQNIGFRSRDLLNLAADEVVLVDACSGVDGTWGMQERFYAESMKVASGYAHASGCREAGLDLHGLPPRRAAHREGTRRETAASRGSTEPRLSGVCIVKLPTLEPAP